MARSYHTKSIEAVEEVVSKPNRRKRPHRKARMSKTGQGLKRSATRRLKRKFL